MDNVTRYAAINTKVRALGGKLLKNDDYTNLLSKKSIPEVAAYLRQKTHYKDILDGIVESETHRGRLEILLKERHLCVLEQLIHYLYDEYREFYKCLLMRYEIEDLKLIVRNIKTNRDNRYFKDSFVHIGLVSNINVEQLFSSKSLLDFIKNLKGTVYYDYLRPLSERKENISIFSIQMTLDLAYFDLFYRSVKSLNKKDREIMESSQGINVDLLNIQWIYRGLKFYNLSPEELFNYTIAYGCEFSRIEIKELCYSRNIDEFQKKILDTRYSFLFDNENTKDIFMERRILRYQFFYLKKIKLAGKMDISQTIVYCLLLEMEIRDLISVVENIRYGMSGEEAKKFLIRKL